MLHSGKEGRRTLVLTRKGKCPRYTQVSQLHWATKVSYPASPFTQSLFRHLFSGVAPADQTKERSVHELFAGAFRNKSLICEFRACFPKEKHQNSQKWAKFMNFSFWPFLWFGLPRRLLIFIAIGQPALLAERISQFYPRKSWHSLTKLRLDN